jgi:hypothetical protein
VCAVGDVTDSTLECELSAIELLEVLIEVKVSIDNFIALGPGLLFPTVWECIRVSGWLVVADHSPGNTLEGSPFISTPPQIEELLSPIKCLFVIQDIAWDESFLIKVFISFYNYLKVLIIFVTLNKCYPMLKHKKF